MINKNDYTIYKKYEGDVIYYNYNFDMIKDELLNITEGYKIEYRIEEYIDDLEYIIEQIVDELNEANSDLNDLQQDYDDLEEEKEELMKRVEELEERIGE